MNEDQPTQEKDFRGIIASMINLGETRDKFINEIDDILDRIKQNRQPREAKEPSVSSKLAGTDVFVNNMLAKILEMDIANERLQHIVIRLSELV